MKISRRAASVGQSVTMAVTARAGEMAAAGIDVISFSVGEPDFVTPNAITAEGIQALEEGKTKYAPAVGMKELREEISLKILRENGLRYDPSQVVVTVGAKHACYEAIHALIDPGDEVLIPTPYWVSYSEMVQLVDGVCRIIPTYEEDDYKLKPDALAAALSDKSKLLILNSPNNPGGFCYSAAELKALGEVLLDSNVAVLSDEVYENLIYGDTEFASFAAAVPEMFDRTITVNGFSKSYAMTGWRIGYVAAATELAEAIGRLQSHMTSGPTTFCQIAACAALRDGWPDVLRMRKAFAERGLRMYERISNWPDVSCIKPAGAFYVFPNVSKLYKRLGVDGSVGFCERLLEESHVACVPGAAFGCDANIRLSFAADLPQIEAGLDRIEAFLKQNGLMI